ncbi:MAG TPA: cytochrome c [Longimicrobiales bacterium]
MELGTRLGVSLSPLAIALLLAARPAAAQSAPADSSRSAEGAYSAAQATEGENTFRTVCGNCHGTAEFSGQTFRKIWTGRPVYELFDLVRNAMPLDNPGGLSRTEYAAVIAYVLKLNGYPAGPAALPVEDAPLRLIRF